MVAFKYKKKNRFPLLWICLLFLFAINCQNDNTTDTPNNPPDEPSNPSPAQLDSNVTVSTRLSWSCSDPDGDPMVYDIYLDTLNPPGLIDNNWPNRNFTLDNSLAYYKTYYWRITAVDINNAETEGLIWRFKTERGSGIYEIGTIQTTEIALEVFVIRDEAYVAEGEYGVEIFDISNPAVPILLGLYQFPGMYAQDVAVVGNYAFVANANQGLNIVDISNPFNPYTAEFVSLPNFPRALFADSLRVFIACDTAGLQIVNVQYILYPFVEGSVSTLDASAEAISIYDNYALLGAAMRGMYIADISDIENPELVGNFDTPGVVESVHAINYNGSMYAYIADGNSGYRVVDFTQPENPEQMALLELPDYVYDVHKAGQHAYLAVNNIGLVIVDEAIPPNIVAYFNTPGQARGLFVTDDYVFVADGTEGVAILEHVE